MAPLGRDELLLPNHEPPTYGGNRCHDTGHRHRSSIGPPHCRRGHGGARLSLSSLCPGRAGQDSKQDQKCAVVAPHRRRDKYRPKTQGGRNRKIDTYRDEEQTTQTIVDILSASPLGKTRNTLLGSACGKLKNVVIRIPVENLHRSMRGISFARAWDHLGFGPQVEWAQAQELFIENYLMSFFVLGMGIKRQGGECGEGGFETFEDWPNSVVDRPRGLSISVRPFVTTYPSILSACECCSFSRSSFPMVWLSARAGLWGGRRGPMHSPFDLEQVPGQPAFACKVQLVQCPGGLLISLVDMQCKKYPETALIKAIPKHLFLMFCRRRRLSSSCSYPCSSAGGWPALLVVRPTFGKQRTECCVSLWGGSTINEPSNVRPKREMCRLEPGSRKDPLAKAVEAVEEAEAGGGRDEGRGRGGRAVVQKIQNRVQQRKDHGGISIAKGSNGSISSSSIDRLARRHPLDGIDVSKLDTITLSDESVAIVERLLRFHHVWEGGGDEEERSPDNNSSANNKKDKDVTNDEAMAPEPLDLDAAAETYDDCCAGDYPDEPEILFEGGRISSSHIDPDEKTGWGDIEDCDESEFVDTPIFRHLTDHFSFKQRDAIDAMKASRKRRVILARKERGDKDANARDNDDKEGALLEMSLDWLSLHLDEDRLRRGFKVQPSKTMRRPIASTVERTFDITAVPHASLSVLPKLTKSQYEKEAKRLNLLTYLVRAGFHVNEVENAFVSIKLESKLDSFGDQSQDFQPLAMLEGHLLRELVQCVIENTSGANELTRLDDDVDLELATASVDERAQEEEVLRAIYAEEFQSLCQEENSRGRFYRLDVNPVEPLAHPACNEKCMIYVLAEGGYP
ncbi:hypothetical protein THAOC_06034 [Thalassiosira oceanica]|uniref:Uncharacterized protein n=1 Tax=Thalassiosira oceanica TaxID=159749 RepID=K0TM63_THAOC|nr:hypothetical protein THAOC_06034 [Thalassiosira oceanica]|eukprot:EJK72437.1 hypothetical protein THAOC_06034 [Thalassiosira oceanica]